MDRETILKIKAHMIEVHAKLEKETVDLASAGEIMKSSNLLGRVDGLWMAICELEGLEAECENLNNSIPGQ